MAVASWQMKQTINIHHIKWNCLKTIKFSPSQTYQYLTNLLIVEEHLTRCFTQNMHLILEYKDMQTQIQMSCKTEQIPQWEVPLWVTVLRHEVADNDSRIRGQWYLKNLTLELSISDASNNPQDKDMFYITDCEQCLLE